MKNVIILFGGVSPEHEVSIITGLQVIDKIDRSKFTTFAIKLTQDGLFKYYERLFWMQDYSKIKPKSINFGRDNKGAFFKIAGIFGKKVYIDIAYLAFHGGLGESGQIQGLLETLQVPYTSSNTEGSAIAMNKVLTKEVLESYQIKTVPWVRAFSTDIRHNLDKTVSTVISKLGLPIIIKPSHLGSSIAINVAKTKADLKKYLLEASQVDSEILIEKFMTNFVEYNISVRKIGDEVEVSEIEKPLSKDEILSFADKYQRGGKKMGGMASLNRELPAKINSKLKNKIEDVAKKSFALIRAKGVLRIDFMYANNEIYVTEINPIPGAMSFFLWEACGISFKNQITDLLNQAVLDEENRRSKLLKYDSDILKGLEEASC
ncbi:MAG: hypothetical protein WA152_01005 [Microgenomates group bacterium]